MRKGKKITDIYERKGQQIGGPKIRFWIFIAGRGGEVVRLNGPMGAFLFISLMHVYLVCVVNIIHGPPNSGRASEKG